MSAASEETRYFERVQILGPFHSGTGLMYHYLQALFDVQVGYHTLFWKHSLPPRFNVVFGNRHRPLPEVPQSAFRDTLFLCMVRLPYFWMLSTARQRYGVRFKNPGDPSSVLRSPARFEGRKFSNLVQLWNAYYRAYEEHIVPHAAYEFVRLEDLVQQPHDVLTRLSRRLRRRPRVALESTIEEISNRPAKVEAGQPCVYGEEARREYVPERVPTRFCADDLAFINRELDPELMQRFDYPFIS